uniref:F-actin monooxygenase n=1 Tax=Phallusia mammillata TaxID=59560 RepID=A0A6F9DKW0_9ASCI|nr:protein-methionine sulfoxide oxidase mical3a [Phallusia mammillata]
MVISTKEDLDNDVEIVHKTDEQPRPSKLFDSFVQAQTCIQTLSTFHELCKAIDVEYPPSQSSSDHCTFYPRLKKHLADSWKAKSLWTKLDKRFFGPEYFANSKMSQCGGRRAAENSKVLIIGGGPCGLRTAIEMACLGAKTIVLEKRDTFSRNNVLHLWPFIITDLKTLGAKKFYGRFCAGAIDHISIRQLQLILLKTALLFGVEIAVNVSFECLSLPTDPVICEDGTVWQKGWSAVVNPTNHPVSNFDFDVVVGADGKRNLLQGFKRKEFRGKLAIGLTVNFINRHTTAEAKVQEISGVAYIFNQEFFKDLCRDTNIDLENIVYYKGETHYFVMTAKKHSLISKGVLKQDYDDTARLLCYENIDQEAMMVYAREAADFSTNHKLPNLEFAINQYGQPDIALFDFTCMYAAENAALFREHKGKKLMSCLVGDSLLEPFWPMGTGCARGFLAAFDLAWMVRSLCLKRQSMNNNETEQKGNLTELEVLAERESIYRLLHHTTPQNTVKNWANYTIDPFTRYTNLNLKMVSVKQVRSLYFSDKDHGEIEEENSTFQEVMDVDKKTTKEVKHPHLNPALTRKVSIVRSNKLQTWCRRITNGYEAVHINDMSSSWRSGLALCAIIHQFRPDLIQWDQLNPIDIERNNQMAFDVAEKYLGISPVMTGKEMAMCQEVDKLVMVTYISQFYEVFKNETPVGNPHAADDKLGKPDHHDVPKSPLSSTSPVGLLIRFTNHIKRKSDKVKNDDHVKKKKYGGLFKRRGSSTSEVIHEHDNKENVVNNGASSDAKTLTVGGTDVQLRPKSANDEGSVRVNQRASNRISALSSQLISQWEQNAPNITQENVPKSAATQKDAMEQSASDRCYFCQRRVYIVERMSAEGLFFHRQCFVCSYCKITLRRGHYEFESESGKFFCRAHYLAHSGAFKTAEQKAIERSESIGKSSGNALANPTTNQGVKMRRPLTERSYQTPERIELENIRMSMLNDPKELSEEAINKHNLSGAVAFEPQSKLDDIDESMSDSSDEDIDWEAVLKAATEQGENKHDESDIESGNHSQSGSSSRGNLAHDRTVMSWLHDGSYIEKAINNGFDDNSTMADIAEELCEELVSGNCNHNVQMAACNGSLDSDDDDSSDSSMATVDLEEEIEEQSRPAITPRTFINGNQISKPTTLPRSCRPSQFSVPEQDKAFRKLFKEIGLPKPVLNNEEPQECLFLSVAEMELQRKQLFIEQSPAKCPISYLPKNELSLLNGAIEKSNGKRKSTNEAIQKWLSGCVETDIETAKNNTNGLESQELDSTTDISSPSNEDDKAEDSMSTASSMSPLEGDTAELVTRYSEVLSKDHETSEPEETKQMDVPKGEDIEDHNMSSLSTASSLEDLLNNDINIFSPDAQHKVVTSPSPVASDPNMPPTMATDTLPPSQPVRKPRTIFNLLSSPTAEKEKSLPSSESVTKFSDSKKKVQEEQNDVVAMATEPLVMEDVADNAELEQCPDIMEEEDPIVEAENPFHPLNRGDTMDRVQDYLIHNPIGEASIQEQDEIAFIDDVQTEDDDVELSSTTSTSTSELNTAKLDVTELLEDNSNTQSNIPLVIPASLVDQHRKTDSQSHPPPVSKATNPPLPRQTSIDSVLLRSSVAAKDNTSVWTNLGDETTSDIELRETLQRTTGGNLSDSFISNYNPGRVGGEGDGPKAPPKRRSSFGSLQSRMKSRLQERQDWFKQTGDETMTSQVSNEAKDAPKSPNVNIQIIEASPPFTSHVTPSAPPKSPLDSDNDQFFTPMGQTPYRHEATHETAASPQLNRVLPKMDDLNLNANETSEDFTSALGTPGNTSLTRRLPPTPQAQSNRRSLPALPKIAHLEALSPTGSPSSPQKSKNSVDQELRATELRVKERVEKLKAQSTNRRISDATKSSSSMDDVDNRRCKTTATEDSGNAPTGNQSASTEPVYVGSSPKIKRKNSFRQKLRRMHKKKAIDEPVEHKMRRALPVPNLTAESTSPFESIPKEDSNVKKKRTKLRKSKSKVESTTTTGSGTESGGRKKVSPNKGPKSLFRISPRKKEKPHKPGKDDEVDGMTTLDRKYPDQSERERAILRGERLRLLPEIPTAGAGSRRNRGRAETFDSPEEIPSKLIGKGRRSTLAGLTPAEIDAKITRRVQIAARRQAKMEAQKRLRRAQVIQRQLEEVEVKQKELEERGVKLEKMLREDGEKDREESECMQEWFQLVQEKNALLRYENELMIYQRELQLEDVQSHLQQELRERMALDDTRKTSAQLAQEREILQKMLDVVEQRDELVGLLEEQRVKEKDEAVDMETMMLSKFNTFANQEQRDNTSSDSVTSSPRSKAVT